MDWFFDGIGTEMISLLISFALGGGVGYGIGVVVTKNKIKQKQKAGDNAKGYGVCGIFEMVEGAISDEGRMMYLGAFAPSRGRNNGAGYYPAKRTKQCRIVSDPTDETFRIQSGANGQSIAA